jgi:hypothetical protein
MKLNRKLPFPYEYLDSFEKLSLSLPSDKDMWYNTLTNKMASDNDINLAHQSFNEYNCKNFGDYMMLYLRLDVLLLLEVFDSFRNNAINEYNLDPLHYYTSPGMVINYIYIYNS